MEKRARQAARQATKREIDVPATKKRQVLNVSAVIDRLVDELVDMEL